MKESDMIRNLLLLFTLLVFLVACSREEPAPPEPKEEPPAVEAPQPRPMPTGPIVTSNTQELFEMGARYYHRGCAQCHNDGIEGAPRLGDVQAWQPRLDKGMHVLVENAIAGYEGDSGLMPARGGNPGMRAEAVSLAVRFMVEMAQPDEEDWDELDDEDWDEDFNEE
ncbi:c-type cytochrome [Geoalkalibacter halelectricus]|uniref:c-type cytochrome n=1 Tax=Geoalkalibacter halelectricus TaxID=2847045 RepID=UPI003D2276BA